MCHSDITAHTYEWSDQVPYPKMKRQALHECRKWDPIYEFARAHSPVNTDKPLLRHPQLGKQSLGFNN